MLGARAALVTRTVLGVFPVSLREPVELEESEPDLEKRITIVQQIPYFSVCNELLLQEAIRWKKLVHLFKILLQQQSL